MSDEPINEFGYFTLVEDEFIRQREASFLVGPLDWQLIESWKEHGVPVHIVCRSIVEVFKNHKSKARRRAINSLRYCQSEVEAQFAEWLESRVGSHDESRVNGVSTASGSDRANPFAKDAIEKYLKGCQDDLLHARDDREAAIGVAPEFDGLIIALTKAYEELFLLWRRFEEQPDARRLEEDLTKLDNDLALAIGVAATPDQVMEAREKVETMMAGYARQMSDESYSKTFHSSLAKHLRELFGVPRLSLFHMKG